MKSKSPPCAPAIQLLSLQATSVVCFVSHIYSQRRVCMYTQVFLHIWMLTPFFFNLVTILVSGSFRKEKHYMSIDLRYIHVNTYFLCVPSSSRLRFNWLDNSSSFPMMMKQLSLLWGPYHCILIWVLLYFHIFSYQEWCKLYPARD